MHIVTDLLRFWYQVYGFALLSVYYIYWHFLWKFSEPQNNKTHYTLKKKNTTRVTSVLDTIITYLKAKYVSYWKFYSKLNTICNFVHFLINKTYLTCNLFENKKYVFSLLLNNVYKIIKKKKIICGIFI